MDIISTAPPSLTGNRGEYFRAAGILEGDIPLLIVPLVENTDLYILCL